MKRTRNVYELMEEKTPKKYTLRSVRRKSTKNENPPKMKEVKFSKKM